MSNSLFGIKAFVKAVLAEKPWLSDPNAVKQPWNEDEYQLVDHGRGKELCFGIVWDDKHVQPSPPVLAALELTKQALIKAGHKVIDWEPRYHKEINAVLVSMTSLHATHY
jgi:amidase